MCSAVSGQRSASTALSTPRQQASVTVRTRRRRHRRRLCIHPRRSRSARGKHSRTCRSCWSQIRGLFRRSHRRSTVPRSRTVSSRRTYGRTRRSWMRPSRKGTCRSRRNNRPRRRKRTRSSRRCRRHTPRCRAPGNRRNRSRRTHTGGWCPCCNFGRRRGRHSVAAYSNTGRRPCTGPVRERRRSPDPAGRGPRRPVRTPAAAVIRGGERVLPPETSRIHPIDVTWSVPFVWT